MSELRQRKTSFPLAPLRELDAFTFNKLPEEIEQKSPIGEEKFTANVTKSLKKTSIFFQEEQSHLSHDS